MKEKVLGFIGLLFIVIGCFISMYCIADAVLYRCNFSHLPYFLGGVASLFIGTALVARYDAIDESCL